MRTRPREEMRSPSSFQTRQVARGNAQAPQHSNRDRVSPCPVQAGNRYCIVILHAFHQPMNMRESAQQHNMTALSSRRLPSQDASAVMDSARGGGRKDMPYVKFSPCSHLLKHGNSWRGTITAASNIREHHRSRRRSCTGRTRECVRRTNDKVTAISPSTHSHWWTAWYFPTHARTTGSLS